VFVPVVLAAAVAAQPSPSPSPSPAAVRLTEDVVVQAVRADADAPVTTAELSRDDLERAYHGQEMPALLARTPSVIQYSETGSGAGYAYFFLRGLHQSRVNMTLDGVPLNDPEESAVFFANFGDFAAGLESVQVQRGVGTSSAGAASFAGSVNFESAFAGGGRRLDLEAGAGAWGSRRGSVSARTGDLRGVALFARASALDTDGYRERSGVTQRAVYLGASHQGERSVLKLFGFTAEEDTELAFLAPDRDTLAANPRANVMASGETDAYGQDFLHAHYTRLVSPRTTAALQAYYSGAQGAFRLFDDPAARATLRSYGIDGHTLGLQGNVRARRGGLELVVGGHGSTFRREHRQDVVGGTRVYTNTGRKQELSGFAKAAFSRGRVHLYGDAQVRHARFHYEGAVPQPAVHWTFFNPKAGLRVALSPGLSAYASVGRTTREPARNDFFAGEDEPTITYDLRAVRPERVVDWEAGLERRTARLAVQANVYAMEFRDEIAATGELSVAGFPLRRNVPRSSRRGLEVDAAWQARPGLRVTVAGHASRDRLAEWTQYVDVYDAAGAWTGQEPRVSRDVRPLLTPGYALQAGAEWSRSPLEAGLSARRVARVFLDNTERADLAAPAWTSVDAFAALSLGRWVRAGAPRLRVDATNLMDARIYAGGYSYQFLTRGAGGDVPGATAYFYPLATRALYVTLHARF
jgi:iron complex outermembrane receptor protein